jgi:molybdopterin-guanine dinucleotide biosynthesis protein A
VAESAVDRADITGIVLAGGRGRRVGGADKGWIEWSGRPLIEHVIARLRPQVAEIVVSANRNRERYQSLGVTVMADSAELEDYAGPLAGIRSALSQVATRWALVVPCDAPRLPNDLAQRLAAGLEGGKAAAAEVAGRIEPLFCLLATDLWLDLDRAITSGERSVFRWLDSVGASRVWFADASEFANFNTLDDMKAP